MKNIQVAILGCGSRGAEAYGKCMLQDKGRFSIVALCDLDEKALRLAKQTFAINDENAFLEEQSFFEKKRADVLVIATPDKVHVRQALKALELGYDVLLEKPVSDNEKELNALLKAQRKYNKKVLVCHVLRYAPLFKETKRLLNDGVIGDLVTVNATERVAYWHASHSYVRGNWRNAKQSTPMILAKCCHDLDLIQYYAGSPCASISSVGDLRFFKRENAPQGATSRCVHCPHKDTCAYSANWYLNAFTALGEKEIWPFNVITKERPITQNALQEAIEKGDYGRCVFHCDNDVVDHQIVTMRFQNGVKATLTMMAFTADGGREISFYGTQGEMRLEEVNERILVRPFGKEQYEISCKVNTDQGGHAHGGGDAGLIEQLYAILTENVEETTSLKNSVQSHLMGIYAERSRLKGGKCIKM